MWGRILEVKGCLKARNMEFGADMDWLKLTDVVFFANDPLDLQNQAIQRVVRKEGAPRITYILFKIKHDMPMGDTQSLWKGVLENLHFSISDGLQISTGIKL